MYSIETTRHLAELSKLSFTDEELKTIHNEMADIIKLMDKVRDADNTDIFVLREIPYSKMRNDSEAPSAPAADILKNSSAVKDKSFTVPKIL